MTIRGLIMFASGTAFGLGALFVRVACWNPPTRSESSKDAISHNAVVRGAQDPSRVRAVPTTPNPRVHGDTLEVPEHATRRRADWIVAGSAPASPDYDPALLNPL